MTPHTFTFQTVGTPTPAHETLRVFVNGASAGLLTLRTDEVAAFKGALTYSPAGVVAWRYRYNDGKGAASNWKLVHSEVDCNALPKYERRPLYDHAQPIVVELGDILRSLLADLPSKRDWLDPVLEQRARDALAKL